MRNRKIFSVVPLVLALSACGGGGSGSGTPPGTGVTASGVFLDAEVEGLTYQSGSSAPRTTDANGTFTYTVGQPLTFSIGGVQLGTLTDGAARCTPDDFVVPLNIARFLQTLDADGNPDNGIDLTIASAALAGTTVSSAVFEGGDPVAFAADADIAAAVATAAAATAATGGEATLIDETIAATALARGTSTAFIPADVSGKAFMVIDPSVPEIGLIQFNTGGTVDAVFLTDTTSVGGDGTGSIENETWTLNANGTVTISDPIGPIVVTKAGQSSRAISATVVDAGSTTALPITLIIPTPITVFDLVGTASKTYDVTNTNGIVSRVTFNADGTLSSVDLVTGIPDPTTASTSLWSINAFGLVEIVDSAVGDTTIVALIRGDLASSGEILVLDSIILGGTSSTPGSVAGLVLEHNAMEVLPVAFVP